jgi:hypothetical protein
VGGQVDPCTTNVLNINTRPYFASRCKGEGPHRHGHQSLENYDGEGNFLGG